MEALVAGALRLDKKCGQSGIAPGKKCNKGQGGQWVMMTGGAKPLNKLSNKELRKRFTENDEYMINKAKVNPDPTKWTPREFNRFKKVAEGSPQYKEQEEILKIGNRRDKRKRLIGNIVQGGALAALTGAALYTVATNSGDY